MDAIQHTRGISGSNIYHNKNVMFVVSLKSVPNYSEIPHHSFQVSGQL